MRIFLILACTLFLFGCSSSGGLTLDDGTPVTKTMIVSKCPVLKQYTPEQLKAAAAELKLLPDDSNLAMLVIDYGKIREACRAITQKLKS